jgi:4-hydroxy-tetrahydrodipicolinate synthase
MVTPFDEKGRIDEDATCQVADFLLDQGVEGLLIAGSTGEGMLLTLHERKILCELVVDHVDDRVPVIVHTGCITTASTIDLTCHAGSAGAAAASVICPYYYGLDDQSLFEHFNAVADAVPDLPIFLYAFPANAGNDVSPSLLKQLHETAPNIVGIKSTNRDLTQLQKYLEVTGPDFTALNGVDGLMLAGLSLGAKGQVSGTANAFPAAFRALYDAFQVGDLQMARSKQRLINRVRLILWDGFHPACFKAALTLRGIPAGHVRPPMRELSAAEFKDIERGLDKLESL